MAKTGVFLNIQLTHILFVGWHKVEEIPNAAGLGFYVFKICFLQLTQLLY